MSNKIKLSLIIMISILLAGCSASRFSEFVTTDKKKLMSGDEELRFVSFNIPNLHYLEDHLPFEETNSWRLPDEFEITDALTAIKQMGATVTRSYVISVRRENDSEDIIRHVEAPGLFNEEAFRSLDKVLQVANKVGVRVIIPLVDNWWWWGGRGDYAAFRGMEKDEFWTDTTLINDFKKTIHFLLNRENTFTGTLYKDDMAILGWETGNELECPYEWNAEIAKYIKSIDKNHLVIEGTHKKHIIEEAVKDTNIDVLSTHYYQNKDYTLDAITKNLELINGTKPYYVGEYGFKPLPEMDEVIDSVIDKGVSGIMLWSLRYRNRDGGFYYHYENNSNSPYRWPGFESGDFHKEKATCELVRDKNAKINNIPVPELPEPEEPVMLPAESVYDISWQGSAGAEYYVIQRRGEESDWQVIEDNARDDIRGYKAQYWETNVEKGKSYYYRIKAVNRTGESDYSNVIGPVKVKHLMLIDEFEANTGLHSVSGEFEYRKLAELRQAKEDRNRLTGKNGEIIWSLKNKINSIKLYSFKKAPKGELQFYSSSDGNTYKQFVPKEKVINSPANDYNFFTPVIAEYKFEREDQRFIKVILNENYDLSRIEINY